MLFDLCFVLLFELFASNGVIVACLFLGWVLLKCCVLYCLFIVVLFALLFVTFGFVCKVICFCVWLGVWCLLWFDGVVSF